jgi:hypothetical protein
MKSAEDSLMYASLRLHTLMNYESGLAYFMNYASGELDRPPNAT